MPDPEGFLHHEAHPLVRRPVPIRLRDWREVYEPPDPATVEGQAARCMDCGIPFCHSEAVGCPLGNLIPDWNDLVRTGNWQAASDRLHATNNFPEFTGRLCPAPCESACVLGLIDRPVTIEQIERTIVDRAWSHGWIRPHPPARRTRRRVAVVGSGPAGLAAAQQLTRAGHAVTVFERSARPGGLLRYGIPAFKLEKHHIDRRIAQLEAEGTRFRTGVTVGTDLSAGQLRADHDAVVLAVGAEHPRELDVPGRELPGVVQAMRHLVAANRAGEGEPAADLDVVGARVVLIGGGDTAADCLGTVHRQGAAEVVQLDVYPAPPGSRDPDRTPWPLWPLMLRRTPAHEEGGEQVFAVVVEAFEGRDRVEAVVVREVRAERRPGGRTLTPVGEAWRLPCDLALLAIGFEGVEPSALLAGLGLAPNELRRIPVGGDWQTTVPGVFACGDATRGASLIVWAIAEGRAAAAAVDTYLLGGTDLPRPVDPGRYALRT